MRAEGERSRAATLVLGLAGYGGYLLYNVFFVLLAVPLLLVLSPFPKLRHRFIAVSVPAALAFLTRAYLPALGIYRIAEISGRDRALACGPAVYIGNHRGFLDGPMVLGLIRPTGWVLKTGYGRWPILSSLVRYFDLVEVDRESPKLLAAAQEKCRHLLRTGRNLLVFPEGTRARSGRLQRFHTLAFRVAVDYRVPVVPVIVHSTGPFMARVAGSLFPRKRLVYRIRFLEPEPVGPGDTADDLCDRVRRRMAREIRDLDRGTVWDMEEGSGT